MNILPFARSSQNHRPSESHRPRRLPALSAVVAFCAFSVWLACTSVLAAQPATAPAIAVKPFLIHLPGISGECRVDHDLIDGLQLGGVGADTEIYDWTCHDPGVPALLAYRRNQAQAQIVADQITRQFRDHPHAPLYVTGHSGGAALAVWALEKLPPDVKVDTLLLLAPALSPQYDLSRALSHVRGHAYAFTSPLDAFILGAGTKVFGTMDGVHGDAAGQIGFTKPDAGDADQYRKLEARPYQADWMKYENIGDHIGVTATPFAQAILAPLLGGSGLDGSDKPTSDKPGSDKPLSAGSSKLESNQRAVTGTAHAGSGKPVNSLSNP